LEEEGQRKKLVEEMEKKLMQMRDNMQSNKYKEVETVYIGSKATPVQCPVQTGMEGGRRNTEI